MSKAPGRDGARLLYAIRPEGLEGFLASLPAGQAAFLRAQNFTACAGAAPFLLPGDLGLEAAVLGLGADRSPFAFGGLATANSAAIALIIDWMQAARKLGKKIQFMHISAEIAALAGAAGLDRVIGNSL